MTKRPRGPQPNWQPSTPLQRGILADLLARYEQHHQEGTLPRSGRGMFYDRERLARQERDERERLPDLIRKRLDDPELL